jgi:NADH-quinone oxidoreductase subunit A
MLDQHMPLIMTLAVALATGLLVILLGIYLGPRRPSAVKGEPFEGGNPSSGPARDRFAVKFYLVAILFLVFDVEAVFIYPWAVVFSDAARGLNSLSPVIILVDMVIFVAILMVGLTYAWRKGALEWGPSARKRIDETPPAP